MLQQHEDFANLGETGALKNLPQSGNDKTRNIRRVIVSEEGAAVSLPDLPWSDVED